MEILSFRLDSRTRLARRSEWKCSKHEIPPKLNMYELAEYRIEIDIQFIITFRLLGLRSVHAFVLYGTIASRPFVRVHINEFIIIISFMRGKFGSVGMQPPWLHQICRYTSETMSHFVCGIRVRWFFASSFAVIREIKTIKSLSLSLLPHNPNALRISLYFLSWCSVLLLRFRVRYTHSDLMNNNHHFSALRFFFLLGSRALHTIHRIFVFLFSSRSISATFFLFAFFGCLKNKDYFSALGAPFQLYLLSLFLWRLRAKRNNFEWNENDGMRVFDHETDDPKRKAMNNANILSDAFWI